MLHVKPEVAGVFETVPENEWAVRDHLNLLCQALRCCSLPRLVLFSPLVEGEVNQGDSVDYL